MGNSDTLRIVTFLAAPKGVSVIEEKSVLTVLTKYLQLLCLVLIIWDQITPKT